MLKLDHFIADCRAALTQPAPERVIKEILERAVDSGERGGHARLDVERPGARDGDVGLPPREDHDGARADGVPDELLELVVAGEVGDLQGENIRIQNSRFGWKVVSKPEQVDDVYGVLAFEQPRYQGGPEVSRSTSYE